MYQRFNISLRLPVHLFIEQDCEQMVVDKIKECYSKINTSWTLKMWMDSDIVDAQDVIEFAEKYEDIFKHRTSFKPKDKIDSNDYVLFEIVDTNNTLPNQEKFNRSRYGHRNKPGSQFQKFETHWLQILNQF